ncbi:MAG: elongation factor G [Myxococcales bacterium]|nr:elongation factor G [Myxococcales bacterium]
MGHVDVANRRSFALIGHAGDGKTTLGEALLHTAGATAELGSVTDGTSVLDHGPEEKERHHTLSSSVFSFDWQGFHLTLVDTPGDPNFQGDGKIALAALDGAIVVVSAVDGVQVGTDSMWRTARHWDVPALAFVTGLDRDRADFDAAVDSLAKMEDAKPIPVCLPMGSGDDFRGVIDLVRPGPDVPDEWADAVAAARERLTEAVAECDDELLEKYLDEGSLSDEDVLTGLIAAVHGGALLPVLCGSGLSEAGAAEALQSVTEWLPSPADRPARLATPIDGGEEIEVVADPDGTFSALVFKTVVDRYAGTLSLLRIVSGQARHDTAVLDATGGNRERFSKLFELHGVEHSDVDTAGPGDIIAVAKLKGVHTGHALTSEKKGLRLEPIPIPKGVLSYAISAKSKGDEDKVFSSLGRIVEEDPTLQLGRDPATGEFLLTGMGELHTRMTVQKLKRQYQVEVELKTPKVPYRETIQGKAENVEGKLKKQTGGKGMYGVCYLTLEPLPRGGGVEFVDQIVGGSIPRNLIPAVEKGVQEAAAAGPLAGYPVVDVRVRCIDGKHHSVDSNEMAFKIAGSVGFKAGVEKAHPTLLEPIMNAEISCPVESVGDIMGDVSGRRGRVQTSEVKGSSQVIKAQVPMAEMLEYASTLTSLTGGKGAFHLEFSHYEEVPAQVRDKIIAEAQSERAREG